MLPDHLPSRLPTSLSRCSLSLLEDHELPREPLRLLTPSEHRLLKARGPARQRRWPRGRLAAKLLTLTHAEAPDLTSDSTEPQLLRLSRRGFDEFPPSSFRDIEILPANGLKLGAPEVFRQGEPAMGQRVALSHTPSASIACLAPRMACGVDLELVRQRVPEFYRINFSTRERRWVEGRLDRGGRSAEWWYTALWTAKEAFLKSGLSRLRSTIDLPALEIRLPDRVSTTDLRGRPSGQLGSVEVGVDHAGSAHTATLSWAALDAAVLAVIRVPTQVFRTLKPRWRIL